MVILVLLSLFLLVRADEEPPPPPADGCKPFADLVASSKVDFFPMPAEAVGPLLIFHNAAPPVSKDQFAAAAYATLPDGTGFIAWLRGDLVCQRDFIPAPVWARLKPLIRGVAS